jgi:hypothetical protein
MAATPRHGSSSLSSSNNPTKIGTKVALTTPPSTSSYTTLGNVFARLYASESRLKPSA